MTQARLDHLRRQIATCKCLGELDGMRVQLSHQGELTTDIMAAIRDRQDEIKGVSRR